MRAESIWNAIGALVVILPLLYFAFRSPWLVAVGAVPSALSVLIVMAAYAWLGIPLSAAAAGAAAMQFGLGIDGVVLLFVAYRHVGRVVSDDGREDLAGPAVSMLLGMWTTAATFYGLAVVDFPSLEELGLLIGHSMMVCGVLTLVLVPALLPATPPAVSALTTGWLPRLVVRRRALILGAAAVITVAAAIAAPRLRIDPSLDRLRATSPAAGFEAEVTTRFGVPRDVYLVVDQGPALEPLLEANERLVAALAREAPGVPAHAPSLLLPSARTQQAAAARIAAQGIAAGPRPGGSDGGGRTPPGFVPAPSIASPRRCPCSSTRAPGSPTTASPAHGLGDLLDRSIVKRDGLWTVVTYLYPPSPAAVDGVRRAVAAAGGTARLSGLPAVNREMAERFTPEFVKGISVGSLIVLVLLVAAFRRWDFTLLALVPTALALTWTAGVLAISGVSLDLFSMFAVMTFVGIGVDYGIHLVHRCAHGAEGDRADAVAHLGPVILVAALTTLFGFGTLVTSSYPPLQPPRARLDGRDRRARRRVAVRPAGAPPQAAPMTASEPLRVVAVIAAFNEGPHIREVVLGTRPHVDAVIVVDDGSTDDTAAAAEAAGAEVVRHPGNRGKGVAVRSGLAAVRGRGFTPRPADGRRPAAPAVGRAAPRRGGGRGRRRRHRRRPELRPRADAGVALLVQRHRQLGARRPRRCSDPGHAIRLPADPAGGARAAHPDVDRLRDRDRDADPARPPRGGRPRSPRRARLRRRPQQAPPGPRHHADLLPRPLLPLPLP